MQSTAPQAKRETGRECVTPSGICPGFVTLRAVIQESSKKASETKTNITLIGRESLSFSFFLFRFLVFSFFHSLAFLLPPELSFASRSSPSHPPSSVLHSPSSWPSFQVTSWMTLDTVTTATTDESALASHSRWWLQCVSMQL